MDVIGFLNGELVQEKQAASLLQCNQVTQQYGQSLTPAQARQVAAAHQTALRMAHRIEFESDIPVKFNIAFCDSPFIEPSQYASILSQLLELFYYYKNELPHTDEELLVFMQDGFNGVCQGSLELLGERELPALVGRCRGLNDDSPDVPEDEGDEQ